MGIFSVDNQKQQIKLPYVHLANQKKLFPTPNLKKQSVFFLQRTTYEPAAKQKWGSIGNDIETLTYNVMVQPATAHYC